MSNRNLTEFELARPLTEAELKIHGEYLTRSANETHLQAKKEEIIRLRNEISANPFRRAFAPDEFKQLFKGYQREIVTLEAERLTYALNSWEDESYGKLDARFRWHRELKEFRYQVEKAAFETFNIEHLVQMSGGYNLPAMLEQYDSIKSLCKADGLRQFARKKKRYAQDQLLQLEQEDSALWLLLDPDKQLGEARRAVLDEIISRLFTSFLDHIAKDLTETSPGASEVVPVTRRAEYDQPDAASDTNYETVSQAEADDALRLILPEAALINDQILVAQLPYYQPGKRNFSDANPLTLRLNTGNQEVDDAWQRVVGWLAEVWGYEPTMPRSVDEAINKGKLYSSELVRLKREIQLVYNAHPLYIEELRLHLLGFNRSVISSLAHEHAGDEIINPGPLTLTVGKLFYVGLPPTQIPPLLIDESATWVRTRLLTAIELHDFLLNSPTTFYTPNNFQLPTWMREQALVTGDDREAEGARESMDTADDSATFPIASGGSTAIQSLDAKSAPISKGRNSGKRAVQPDLRDASINLDRFLHTIKTADFDEIAKAVGFWPPVRVGDKLLYPNWEVTYAPAKLNALYDLLKGYWRGDKQDIIPEMSSRLGCRRERLDNTGTRKYDTAKENAADAMKRLEADVAARTKKG